MKKYGRIWVYLTGLYSFDTWDTQCQGYKYSFESDLYMRTFVDKLLVFHF